MKGILITIKIFMGVLLTLFDLVFFAGGIFFYMEALTAKHFVQMYFSEQH